MNYKNTVFNGSNKTHNLTKFISIIAQHSLQTGPIRTQDTRITQLTLQRASQLLAVMQTSNQKEGKRRHVFEVNLPSTQGSTGSYHQFL